MTKINSCLLAASILVLGACTESGAAAPATTSVNQTPSTLVASAPKAPVNYQLETLASGLDHPWSLAFLPGGDMLVTERSGRVKHRAADGTMSTVLDLTDHAAHPVHVRNQAGLFEIALHPDFMSNQLVFISYAGKEKPGSKNNALVLARYKLSRAGEKVSLSDGEILFKASPFRRSSAHYGGRIAFLPDGTLLLPNGDGYTYREDAQTLDNHHGKIMRLNLDGSVPADNPFADTPGALPEIWSYGHRNPQGITVMPSGDVLSNEHGPKGGDELNRIAKGINYGWPVITYGIDYSGAKISPFQQKAGMAQSLIHYVPSIAPAGMAVGTGDKFPAWQGDLFIPALAHKLVRRIDIKPGGSAGAQEDLFTELGERIRDARFGPGGHMYLLTETRKGAGGKLIKVSPK